MSKLLRMVSLVLILFASTATANIVFAAGLGQGDVQFSLVEK